MIPGNPASLSDIWAGWLPSNGEDDLSRGLLSPALVVLAVSWLFWILVGKSRKLHPPLPPGPTGLPIVGNLPFLDPELHTYFTELARTYGPILTLKLGGKVGVVVASPAMAREVLKDNDVTFANRDVPFAALDAAYGGRDIVWNPHGPEWRMLRKVCVREMLSNASLDSVYELRRREIRQTIRYFYGRAGSPVNVGEQIFLTIMNVVTNMLWGGTIEGEERSSVGAEFRQVVAEITVLLGIPNLSDFFPGLARFDMQGIQRKMKGLATRFDRIFEGMIEQRLKIEAKGDGGKDFLQFLLNFRDAGGDSKTPFTMTHVKSLLMVSLVPPAPLLCAFNCLMK